MAAVQDFFAVRGRQLDDSHVYGALFIGAIAFFCLGRVLGDRLGLVSDLIAIAANATCGWSWLLARALFRPKAVRASPWPLAAVLVLVAAGAFRQFVDAEPFAHVIGNVQELISATVLLLALSEPLRDMRKDLPQDERRFRLVFLSGHASLTVVAVVLVSGAPADSLLGHWSSAIKLACAVLAVTGAGVAIWYRGRFPMPEQDVVRRRTAVPGDEVLAARILALLKDEAVYTVSNLKVADLARRLNKAEYKVTQCITGALGFRNFNHMINHFRIAQAAQKLADPACDHLPVLTIALDCGFGSIGPFNRAFKAQFGDTPTAFREARRTRLAA